jgi:hypothetical protein
MRPRESADLFADVVRDRHHHRSAAIARRHRIHGDTLARDLAGQRHRETMQSGFRCRVIGLPELAGLAVHRRDVDDAPETAFAHAFDDSAAHVEHAVHVHTHQVLPLCRRHLAQRGVAGDAGGIHEYVDAAVLRNHAGDQIVAGGFVRDIQGFELYPVAEVGHLGAEFGDAIFACTEIGGDDRAAGFGQFAADRRTETADTTRDNGDALRHELSP